MTASPQLPRSGGRIDPLHAADRAAAAAARPPPDLPTTTGLGRDSLFFYLWHPLAFGLWASCGVTGLPMLVLSLGSMILARAGIARMPGLRAVFGVRPPDTFTRAPTPQALATASPGAMV